METKKGSTLCVFSLSNFFLSFLAGVVVRTALVTFEIWIDPEPRGPQLSIIHHTPNHSHLPNNINPILPLYSLIQCIPSDTHAATHPQQRPTPTQPLLNNNSVHSIKRPPPPSNSNFKIDKCNAQVRHCFSNQERANQRES